MKHSDISWIQIPAKDLARAAKFYSGAFGYEFFFETLNNIPHAIFKEDSTGRKPVNGAIIEIADGDTAGHGPVLFFEATGNFEEILEGITEHEGTILHSKTLIKKKLDDGFSEIPNTYIDSQPGYFAHFIDSEGNRMGLYGQY